MIFLLITIIGNALLSIVMRLSEGRIRGKVSMLAANYLTCVILSGFYIGFGNMLPSADKLPFTLALGGVNGFFYIATLLLMQVSIKRDGVVLPSVFSKMGSLLVPFGIAICAFGEVPKGTQIIGAILAFISIILINYEKGDGQVNAKWLLILILISDGIATSMSKIFRELGNDLLSDHFVFYTFAGAFILSVILLIYKKERPGMREVFYGILLGVPNFVASRTILKALKAIPAVIVYPTRGVCSILLVLLAGIFLFREKLRKHQWVAIGVILVAVALLNI